MQLSGKLNNRLLCEIISHGKFQRLLANIDIYMDNINGMQIRNLNSWIYVARDEVIAKYNLGKDDPHLFASVTTRIDENKYFYHMVNEDIDGIISDIRIVYKHDRTSVP